MKKALQILKAASDKLWKLVYTQEQTAVAFQWVFSILKLSEEIFLQKRRTKYKTMWVEKIHLSTP